MLLTTPVINESYSSPFLVHAMEVPVPREQVLDKEAKLRAACEAETTAFMADAEAYFAKRMRERGLEQPHLAPRLLIRLDDAVKATFVVTFVCPARRRGYVEQAILRRFLNDSATAEAPSPAPVADGAEP